MLDEKEILVFVHGAMRYFERVTRIAAKAETPFLANPRDTPGLEITGVIGVSGARKGVVYLTAASELLSRVLACLGERDQSLDMQLDLAGEIANTIAGNAREHFGADFMISVPVVVQGKLDRVQLPADLRSFVIPLLWMEFEAYVVVCLE